MINVGGVAALTMLINATFAEHVLALLKLSEKMSTSTESIDIMRQYTKKRLIKSVLHEWLELPEAHRIMLTRKCVLLKLIDDAKSTYKPDSDTLTPTPATVTTAGTINADGGEHGQESAQGSNVRFQDNQLTASERAAINKAKKHRAVLRQSSMIRASQQAQLQEINPELMVSVRTAFSECVRSYYWTRVQKKILPRYSYVTRTLIASVDLGLETISAVGLQDWDYIVKNVLDKPKSSASSSAVDSYIKFLSKPLEDAYAFLRNNVPLVESYELQCEEDICLILSYFISAHKHAQTKIPYCCGDVSGEIDTLEQAQVVQGKMDV